MNRRAVRLLQLSFAFAVLAVSSLAAQSYPSCGLSIYTSCASEGAYCAPKPVGSMIRPGEFCVDASGTLHQLYNFTCPWRGRSGICYG